MIAIFLEYRSLRLERVDFFLYLCTFYFYVKRCILGINEKKVVSNFKGITRINQEYSIKKTG